MNQGENVVDLSEHFRDQQAANKLRQRLEKLQERREQFDGPLDLAFASISSALDRGKGVTITITEEDDPTRIVVRTAQAKKYSKEG